MTHRIRLRGFWEVSPLGEGQLRHRRSFGRPRTLDPGETVWLVGEALPGPARVLLNGEALGEAEAGHPFAFEVTSRLAPRNMLTIETDGQIGEVAVEIRAG